jgi:hypothetical protein
VTKVIDRIITENLSGVPNAIENKQKPPKRIPIGKTQNIKVKYKKYK